MNETRDLRGSTDHPSLLILSDDPEFARSVTLRWQAERSASAVSVATTRHWRAATAAGHDLLVVGSLAAETRSAIFAELGAFNKPVIYVAAAEGEVSALRANHPHLLIVEHGEGWLSTLILLGMEILRRVEILGRAHRAERLAVESQGYAVLGRYMLDMRPNVNDALTSVLGNADLLLLEPGQEAEKTREQIKTIHRMSIRLSEIMQRFSSLACEMQAAEEFQPESAPEPRRSPLNSRPLA